MTAESLRPECPFGRFHHVGLVVALEKYQSTVDALCRLLGGTVEDGGFDDLLDMRWAFVRSAQNPLIEVASPLGHRATALTRHLEVRGGGLHHVSFENFDIGAAALHIDLVDLTAIGRNDDHDGYAEVFVAREDLGGALLHTFEDRRGLGKA